MASGMDRKRITRRKQRGNISKAILTNPYKPSFGMSATSAEARAES